MVIGRLLMEIFAPYLQHLEISGDLYDLKCILEDVSSVVTAKLTFNNVCIRNIQSDYTQQYNPAEDSCRLYHQFFMSLVHDSLVIFCNAKELTIGTWFTEFQGTLLPEVKCKYLTLELHVLTLIGWCCYFL
ncbi:hypothetical protein KY285_021076 [Solanum tuberosum]|nr:hypothetical protein KY285_021076 [Solanum tuberosum]